MNEATLESSLKEFLVGVGEPFVDYIGITDHHEWRQALNDPF